MMSNNITLPTLVKVLKISVHKGIENAIELDGASGLSLKKSDAYRQFGRTIVDRWIKEGLIKIKRTSHKGIRISQLELKKVARSSNRNTYLEVEDRK